MNLDECLPPALRGATITPVGAGLSGAGVYRVNDSHILKLDDRLAALQRLAGEAGLAPRVVHVDEVRHAIVTELIVDKGFLPMMIVPSTRDQAIALLGETLRRVHALPLPPDLPRSDARTVLADLQPQLAGFAVPAFVGPTLQAILDEPAPPDDRLVVSHNDVNPTNLVFDGERLLLVDWATAGANDPTFDLAAAAVFFRLDARPLFEAYDGSEPPPRYFYNRRLVAALAGTLFLKLAREAGHPGGDHHLSLDDFYAKRRAGEVSHASPEGQWLFGLALLEVSQQS